MKLKFWGYFIFVAGSILFSLYVHFPGETAATYIEKTFSQTHPELSLQIDTLHPSFPPGIKADAIRVGYRGMAIATLNKFTASFDLTTLFNNAVTGSFKTRVFDGILSGVLRASKEKPRVIGAETEFNDLKLKDIPLGETLADGKLSGIANGILAIEFKHGLILKNKGEVNFSDLILRFPNALFAVETYAFSSGKLKFFMPEDHIIKIEEFNVTGRQLDLHSSGEIRLAETLQRSRLNINAKVVLYPLFFMNAGDSMPVDVSKTDSDNAVIHLRIGGTIQYPRITVDQRTK